MSPLTAQSPLGAGLQRPMAVVMLGTRAGRAPSPDPLATLYGLTPAETRVARSVGDGLTIGEIAQETGASVETLRSQLKSIFGKTGVRRQAELVRLLAGLPAIAP